MEKFIVTPKEDKSVTMTIRIDRALQEEYNDLAAKTNRSRNELISMALQYALDHMQNLQMTFFLRCSRSHISVYLPYPWHTSSLLVLVVWVLLTD